jgi:hypothetical protein
MFFKDVNRRLRYQSGEFGISILFAFSIIALYYFFNYVQDLLAIPENIKVIFIAAIALIILIPLRNRVTGWWEGRVYGTNVRLEGDISLFLRLLAQHENINSMLEKSFPVLMQRFKVHHAVFGILQPRGQSYDVYYYSDGRIKRVPRVKISRRDRFIRTLSRELISTGKISGEVAISGIRNRLLQKNSKQYIALPYRGRLIGFWALPDIVTGKIARELMHLFAIKAALTIFNERLRPMVELDDSKSQEFIVADKIKSFLKQSPIPNIRGWDIKLHTSATAYLEFINPQEFIYVRNLSMFPSGILITSAIGLIHSGRDFSEGKILDYVSKILKDDFQDVATLCYLHGRIEGDHLYLQVIGDHFYIKTSSTTTAIKPKRKVMTWPMVEENLVLHCEDLPFLEFTKKEQ